MAFRVCQISARNSIRKPEQLTINLHRGPEADDGCRLQGYDSAQKRVRFRVSNINVLLLGPPPCRRFLTNSLSLIITVVADHSVFFLYSRRFCRALSPSPEHRLRGDAWSRTSIRVRTEGRVHFR